MARLGAKMDVRNEKRAVTSGFSVVRRVVVEPRVQHDAGLKLILYQCCDNDVLYGPVRNWGYRLLRRQRRWSGRIGGKLISEAEFGCRAEGKAHADRKDHK